MIGRAGCHHPGVYTVYYFVHSLFDPHRPRAWQGRSVLTAFAANKNRDLFSQPLDSDSLAPFNYTYSAIKNWARQLPADESESDGSNDFWERILPRTRTPGRPPSRDKRSAAFAFVAIFVALTSAVHVCVHIPHVCTCVCVCAHAWRNNGDYKSNSERKGCTPFVARRRAVSVSVERCVGKIRCNGQTPHLHSFGSEGPSDFIFLPRLSPALSLSPDWHRAWQAARR